MTASFGILVVLLLILLTVRNLTFVSGLEVAIIIFAASTACLSIFWGLLPRERNARHPRKQ
jgi:hypothetical protein